MAVSTSGDIGRLFIGIQEYIRRILGDWEGRSSYHQWIEEKRDEVRRPLRTRYLQCSQEHGKRRRQEGGRGGKNRPIQQ